jgi:hypothetical protein
MKVDLIPVDTEVYGRPVLSLSEVQPGDDLAQLEAGYVADHHPAYVSARVPMEDLSTIHCLERQGFSLIECQLRLVMRFKTDFDVSRHDYVYERVTEPEQLEEVLDIARNTIVHDRFSIDPEVPREFSGRRYEAYVRQSFERSDEEVWRLYCPKQKRTLNFRTHRRTGEHEVLLLLGGVHHEMQGLGLGVIASHFCFNQMRRDGVKRAVTHISAINKPVFDLEVSAFGFRYQGVFAVLRKCYASPTDQPLL